MSLISPLDKNINGNFEWRANENISNSFPIKDVNQNPLSFEYGYSEFKDYQIILVQSIEVICKEDSVDKIKPRNSSQLSI